MKEWAVGVEPMSDGMVFVMVFLSLLVFVGGLTRVRHRHRLRRYRS